MSVISTEEPLVLRTGYGHNFAVAFSADGSAVGVGTAFELQLWDVNSAVQKRVFRDHSLRSVLSLSFAANGDAVATSSDDKTIVVRRWSDDPSKKPAIGFAGHSDVVNSVRFGRNARFLCSASDDRSVKVWDCDKKECVQTLSGHSERVLSAVLSVDDRFVFSGSYDGAIRQFDVQSGLCVWTQSDAHSYAISCLALSHSGDMLVSGSFGLIKLWDLRTRTCTAVMGGHFHFVSAVDFSPDDSVLASASYDRYIRLFSLPTGECLSAKPEAHSQQVLSIAFAPDGRRVVSGGSDGAVKIWKLISRPYSAPQCSDAVESVGRACDVDANGGR